MTRNTERERSSSEKAEIILPCFDSNSSSNKNSRKQNMMSLSQGFQSCFSEASKDGLSLPWPHNPTTFTKMLDLSSPSHSFLSAKSLEMCTESLGSESGSCIDQFHVITGEINERERKISCVKPTKKVTRSFPPPLSSIGGSEGGVRVRTHREGGRLVVEAFTLPESRCCFVAERGDGRLRLSLPRHGGGVDDGGEVYVKEGAAAGCGKVGCVFGGSGIRCNGNGGSRKRLQSLHMQFCVAGIS